MNFVETVISSSCGDDEFANICVWNPQTGSILTTLKGGNSEFRTMATIKKSSVVSAQSKKNYIQIWPLRKKDVQAKKIVTPGPVTAISVSPCGNYLIAGIQEKIYVWIIVTGDLMSVLSRHYQKVTFLKFTDDGSHFVSAAVDNMAIVWNLAKVVSSDIQTKQPERIWNNHSLPITDVHVGPGGFHCRVVTCSLDQTCQMYDMASGELILSVAFDVALSSVCVDFAQIYLYAGSSQGHILQVFLPKVINSRAVSSERGITHEELKGHKKEVTSLAVTIDGAFLISGSQDESCKVWHTLSKQCIRTFQHKGSVSNVMLVQLTESNLNNTSAAMSKMAEMKNFQRSVCEEPSNPFMYIRCKQPEDLLNQENPFFGLKCGYVPDFSSSSSEDLSSKVSKLQGANSKLYEFIINELTSDDAKRFKKV